MKTHALQRTDEALEAQPKACARRSGSKIARAFAGGEPPILKNGAYKDGRKHSGAQKLTYKEAFREMAAQADAEMRDWAEWDVPFHLKEEGGGLA